MLEALQVCLAFAHKLRDLARLALCLQRFRMCRALWRLFGSVGAEVCSGSHLQSLVLLNALTGSS